MRFVMMIVHDASLASQQIRSQRVPVLQIFFPSFSTVFGLQSVCPHSVTFVWKTISLSEVLGFAF